VGESFEKNVGRKVPTGQGSDTGEPWKKPAGDTLPLGKKKVLRMLFFREGAEGQPKSVFGPSQRPGKMRREDLFPVVDKETLTI